MDSNSCEQIFKIKRTNLWQHLSPRNLQVIQPRSTFLICTEQKVCIYVLQEQSACVHMCGLYCFRMDILYIRYHLNVCYLFQQSDVGDAIWQRFFQAPHVAVGVQEAVDYRPPRTAAQAPSSRPGRGSGDHAVTIEVRLETP